MKTTAAAQAPLDRGGCAGDSVHRVPGITKSARTLAGGANAGRGTYPAAGGPSPGFFQTKGPDMAESLKSKPAPSLDVWQREAENYHDVMNVIEKDREGLNARATEARERLKSHGINVAAVNAARAYAKATEGKRAAFDTSYEVGRKAVGFPIQSDLFADGTGGDENEDESDEARARREADDADPFAADAPTAAEPLEFTGEDPDEPTASNVVDGPGAQPAAAAGAGTRRRRPALASV